eukprot:COSAG01_NODE_1784_length_9237_cov_11.706829_9_plen_63_part_00
MHGTERMSRLQPPAAPTAREPPQCEHEPVAQQPGRTLIAKLTSGYGLEEAGPRTIFSPNTPS